jgi:protein-L-isoaspartate(D-aspartate) O-methyltransferase
MDRDRFLSSLATRVRDDRVLDAVAAVPRELFVSASLASAAYNDAPLRIGHGQTISQPTLVARMCELLELRPTDRVLDVGTGSGYHAAVLSRLCDHVWGVELHEQLALRAARTLVRAGIDNVTVIAGDGAAGLPEHAPFDAINVAATAGGGVPPALEQQLALGGRLVAPVADEHGERLVLVRRLDGGYERSRLEPVRFVPLRQSGH